MKIYPVNHPKSDKNRYCGPSAISIVTGMASGEAARLIRATSRAKQVQGTSDWQMERALAKCGITMRSVWVQPQPPKEIRAKVETRPTLTQWYRDTQKLRTPGRVFLVSAGHHWQIVTGRRFCCGKTKEIVSITAKGTNRRARVEGVYELTAKGKITIPEIARKPKTAACPFRRSLKAIERNLGTKGRVVRDGDWTDYEIDPCPTFPKGLSVCHYDYSETLDRVETILDDPAIYEQAVRDNGSGHVSF